MDDLRSIIQESWGKAVLAASSVEEQAQQLVGRLKGLGPEGAQKLLAEVSGKLQAHRRELQSQVEEAVRRGLDRLRLPTRADVKGLVERLDALDEKVARLEEKHKG